MRRSVFVSLLGCVVSLSLAAVLVVHFLLDRSGASRFATGPPPGPYRGSEPPTGIRAPQFSLKSYRGSVVEMRSLRGKVVLVTFLDTKCRTKCPLIAADIGEAMRLLSPSERLRVAALAISVEPRTDTPRSVRAFLKRRHALGLLDFLIGSRRRLEPVWRDFYILAAAQTGNADIHSADVRVFARGGVWVSTLHVPVDLTPANLAHDVRVALARETEDSDRVRSRRARMDWCEEAPFWRLALPFSGQTKRSHNRGAGPAQAGRCQGADRGRGGASRRRR